MNTGLLLKIAKFFKVPYGGVDVDFVDQLNYQFTSGIIAVFVIVIGIRQYVGKPIQCWVPQEFTKAWEEYAENLCWVQNTYFLSPDENIPITEVELNKMRYIGYYQWVAIVLSGQALMSWIPNILWRLFSRKVFVLLRSAREASIPEWNVRKKAISCLVNALEEQSHINTQYYKRKGIFRRYFTEINPSYRVTAIFILVRILFVTNCFSQIVIMRVFIGSTDFMFGYHVFQNLIQGNHWKISGIFPRVTFCTIRVRKLGQLKPGSYTLQCILPINYFIEKVYVFLWFWFMILGILTTVSTIQWIVSVCVPPWRVQFIRQYLKALKLLSGPEEKDCNNFVNKKLGCDGVFLLQSVSKISSDLIALDVAGHLWRNFKTAKSQGKEDELNNYIKSVHRGPNSM